MSDLPPSSNEQSSEDVSEVRDLAPMPLAIGPPPAANTSLGQRRQPQNLQGALRYSIEVGAGSTSSGNTMGPMDPERRSFLEATLRSLSINPVDRIKTFVGILQSPDASVEDCEKALEEIIDVVDNIDNANDFHKIGAFKVFATHLSSPSSGVRSNTAKLIAVLSQNNPYIQSHLCETDTLATLLALMSDPEPQVRVDALYAVSCAIRGSEAGLRQFTELDGWRALLAALAGPEKMQLKAAFLVTSLAALGPEVADRLAALDFVQQLCGLLPSARPPALEHLLRALVAVATGSRRAAEICAENRAALVQSLAAVVDTYGDDTDEFRFAQELKEAVFPVAGDDEGER